MAKSSAKTRVKKGAAGPKSANKTKKAGTKAKKSVALKSGKKATVSGKPTGAATKRASKSTAPVSTDIRRGYIRSLLGDFLDQDSGRGKSKAK